MQLTPVRGRLPVDLPLLPQRRKGCSSPARGRLLAQVRPECLAVGCSSPPRGDGYPITRKTCCSEYVMQLIPVRGRVRVDSTHADVLAVMQLTPARGRLLDAVFVRVLKVAIQLSPVRGRLLQ